VFGRDSRYRDVPTSATLAVRGALPLGVELRFIDPVEGRFVHHVLEHDRLDLLAYKYYADSSRWWLIADANPGFAWPPDLLDTRPLVTEEIGVSRRDFGSRLLELLAALGPTGELVSSSPFAVRVGARYPSEGERGLLVARIRATGFAIRSSFAWTQGGETKEAFTLGDDTTTRSWNTLLRTLESLAGVRRASSMQAGETLLVVYNTAVLSREALVRQIDRAGFDLVPQRSRREDRTGAPIVIPPTQAA
jgi:hypothetical protein